MKCKIIGTVSQYFDKENQAGKRKWKIWFWPQKLKDRNLPHPPLSDGVHGNYIHNFPPGFPRGKTTMWKTTMTSSTPWKTYTTNYKDTSLVPSCCVVWDFDQVMVLVSETGRLHKSAIPWVLVPLLEKCHSSRDTMLWVLKPYQICLNIDLSNVEYFQDTISIVKLN